MNIFGLDWISWTKTAESGYKFFDQKSAFLLPRVKQEQTYNIAAGLFIHGLILLSMIHNIRMIVSRVLFQLIVNAGF